MSKLKEKKQGFLKLQLRERARQRSPRSATRKRSGTCGFFVVCWWQQMGHKTFRSLVHHCFWETSNYPKKGFTMAVSLPYLPADPKRIYAINYENKSCLKRGPYCHLIPGDPEQLVSLFLLSFFFKSLVTVLATSWALKWCFLIPRTLVFPRRPRDNSGQDGFVQGPHLRKPLSTSLPSFTPATPPHTQGWHRAFANRVRLWWLDHKQALRSIIHAVGNCSLKLRQVGTTLTLIYQSGSHINIGHHFASHLTACPWSEHCLAPASRCSLSLAGYSVHRGYT